MNQEPIILTEENTPVVKIEPFSKMWRKIRRTMRKRGYQPGQGKGAPVPTQEIVQFKSGPMVRYSDGSLRRMPEV